MATTITIKGIETLTAKLNNLGDVQRVVSTMNQATLLVQGKAKALAPVDTGNLRGSIHPKVERQGSKVLGKVYTNLSYAPYVEFGTGSKGNGSYPYANEANVSLKYSSKDNWVYTPDGGETFYRTSGQIAQPYMYPALKQSEKQIKEMFRDTVRKGGK